MLGAGAMTARRVISFLLLLVVSWSTMTVLHESGHLLAGWAGGGTLLSYDLRPWSLPYTVFNPDPAPLLTLWGGPVFGVLAPLIVAVVVRRDWAWLISDFCTLANGTYLALAWISGDPHLDTPRLIDAGASPIVIALFCVATISLGYARFRGDCVKWLGSTGATESSHED